MFQMALLLCKESNCAKLFWNLCMNIEFMAKISSIYDHFIIWSSSVTLTFNLQKQMFQMALLLLKENTCAKLFWNPCINVEFMALTSSIYDHFIIWSSSLTLTFNLPKQMFQMKLLLLKENTCTKLFWSPCTNEGVMARTTYLCDYQVWSWPSTYLKKCFKWQFSSRTTTVSNNFEIHAKM